MMSISYFVQSIITLILFQITSGGWIDPDTPNEKYVLTSYDDGTEIKLVFSDEFNIDNRRFYDGYDPKWTAIDKDDYTNSALQYYNSSLVKTENGRTSREFL